MFNSGGQRAVGSSADYESPPIIHVLNARNCNFFIDSFRSVMRSKNEVALERLSKQLSDYGLDHIAYAFVRGVRVDMYCSRCGRRLVNIDELCYCPIAEDKCHHRNCCAHRNNRALTFY
ncbi:hypothetical protein niasHT_026993 [Heterodera trifolii]|uniref:Uncharacterized protein n=1 Tax=Heterodera trifolii TaxID=157864 RepID=A0ABD2JIY7_9BILA